MDEAPPTDASADVSSTWLADAWAALRPPTRMTLSEWADAEFWLSAENSADPGRWHTLPHQRGIMDAITDPNTERVTVIKSARIGYTKMVGAVVAYYMAQDPCPLMVVQPTVEDAEGYSVEEIGPMLRDVAALHGLVREGGRSSGSRILHKTFPGGVLGMVGATSARGLRRVSRRVVIFDEVDAYPVSAGTEGDPIALGEKRAQSYWNRKIIAGSTPLIAGSSRIAEMFEAGDRRRFYVPCPECGHMDFLRFRKRDGDQEDRGHRMRWPDDSPRDACFECSANGCVIEERSKSAMLEAGEWRADRDFDGHASFHIWAAYSMQPNARWGDIAEEFVAAKGSPQKLQTFVNTTLGEVWRALGEAPDWDKLYRRRELYPIGTVPAGPIVLTAGVDVQKDRLVYEVVGWGKNLESWSVEADELHGDTSIEAGDPGSPWTLLEQLLGRTFDMADGGASPIAMMAVDSGYNTQTVYGWCRQHPMSRVIATKGQAGARALVGTASPVDVTVRGKRMQRGYKMWPVGVDLAKSELYGRLRLELDAEGAAPSGYCHFPEYGEGYFKQLTAEHLVTVVDQRTRRAKLEWHVQPNRENHFLDARILARVAAALVGIDQVAAREQRAARAVLAGSAPPAPRAPAPAPPRADAFWSRPRGKAKPGGWFGRRR